MHFEQVLPFISASFLSILFVCVILRLRTKKGFNALNAVFRVEVNMNQ
jgi:hypothetical protein